MCPVRKRPASPPSAGGRTACRRAARHRRRRPGLRCSIPTSRRAGRRRGTHRRLGAVPSLCRPDMPSTCHPRSLPDGSPPGDPRTYDRPMKQLSGVDVSFLNMETPAVYGHVASMTIYDPEGAPGGAGVEATKQVILERIDELAPFRRRLVQVPLGSRPALLDRGPGLRHRLPRPPSRRAAAGIAQAAGRGGQPDPRPAARPEPAAVGALRDRGRGWRHAHRAGDQGPPRHDRRRVRRADAGGHPRHRARRSSPGRGRGLDARPRADGHRAAPAHGGAVRPQPREVHPAVGEDVARPQQLDGTARPAGAGRRHRPTVARAARQRDAPAPPRLVRTRSTIRRPCRRRRRRARPGTRRSRRTAASRTRRSHWRTRRRSAAPSAARSTTS